MIIVPDSTGSQVYPSWSNGDEDEDISTYKDSNKTLYLNCDG
jgi:hypothetical protein